MSTTNIFTSSFHEQDPRWSAVDAYTLSHLHPPSRPNHASLTHALENSRVKGLPDISSYPAMAKFFALQCRMGGVKHALEIGTLGGYTSIWLATMNPEMKVTTLEIDPVHAEVARQNLAEAGVADRVNVIVGPALDAMSGLHAEIERGNKPPFGFVFIDADKENNWTYFDLAVKMSATRACVFVDNVVVKGNLVNPEAQGDEMVQGARQVIEEVGRDKRVEAVVLQTVCEKSYDGVLMAVVL